MVTIRIQRIDDVISAYLQGLGFDAATAAEKQADLKKYLSENGDSGDEIINFLDNRLYLTAQQIFSNSQLEKPQLIALLKFCFLQCNGAKKWGTDLFDAALLSEEMSTALLNEIIHVAPNYVLSHMQPQPIELPHPGKLIKKIFKPKK